MADNPVHVVAGWSATTTVAAMQFIATVLLGGGGLYGIARAIALLWKMNTESKKQDSEAAAAVRKEMMDISDRQQARIDALEKDATEERKRHGEEMMALRRHYEGELAQLRRQVAALTHQLIVMQGDTGRATKLAGPSSEDMKDILNIAFPPVVDDDADKG
jgi:hypothetical protein